MRKAESNITVDFVDSEESDEEDLNTISLALKTGGEPPAEIPFEDAPELEKEILFWHNVQRTDPA